MMDSPSVRMPSSLNNPADPPSYEPSDELPIAQRLARTSLDSSPPASADPINHPSSGYGSNATPRSVSHTTANIASSSKLSTSTEPPKAKKQKQDMTHRLLTVASLLTDLSAPRVNPESSTSTATSLTIDSIDDRAREAQSATQLSLGEREVMWKDLDDYFDKVRRTSDRHGLTRLLSRQAAESFVCFGCSSEFLSAQLLDDHHHHACDLTSRAGIDYAKAPDDQWVCTGTSTTLYPRGQDPLIHSTGCQRKFCFKYFRSLSGINSHLESGLKLRYNRKKKPFSPSALAVQGVHYCGGLCGDLNCDYESSDWSGSGGTGGAQPISIQIVHKRIASHVFHHHRRILELAVRVKAARLIALQLETYSDFHRTTTSIYVFALKYYETSRISYREWRMNHPIKTLSGSLAEGVVGKEVLDNVGRQTIIPCLNCGTTLSPRYRADKGFCDNCYVLCKANDAKKKLIPNPLANACACGAFLSARWYKSMCYSCFLVDPDRVPVIRYGGPCVCGVSYTASHWRTGERGESLCNPCYQQNRRVTAKKLKLPVPDLIDRTQHPSPSNRISRIVRANLSVKEADDDLEKFMEKVNVVPPRKVPWQRDVFMGHDEMVREPSILPYTKIKPDWGARIYS